MLTTKRKPASVGEILIEEFMAASLTVDPERLGGMRAEDERHAQRRRIQGLEGAADDRRVRPRAGRVPADVRTGGR